MIVELATQTWNGIPPCLRGKIWKMLSGYISTDFSTHQETLEMKRKEYQGFVSQYYHSMSINYDIHRQIMIDIPRTHPNLQFLNNPEIIKLYERVLYIWSVRHPASGYVQGINDLIAPFLIVYLWQFLDDNFENDDMEKIPTSVLSDVEADVFWSLSFLLDSFQDNYTADQPGIQKRVKTLERIIFLADNKLYNFISKHDVNFLQFSLRWMNNLLVREIPMACTLRLWDTYFSENDFDKFHIYVCAALLMKFSNVIMKLQDFQEVTYFIQNFPTFNWEEENINVLVAEAFQLQCLYTDPVNRY